MRLAFRTRLAAGFAFAVMAVLTPYVVGVLALEWQRERRALDHHLREDLAVARQMVRRLGSGIQWATGEGTDPGYDAGAQRWVELYSEAGEPIYSRGIVSAEPVRSSVPRPPALGMTTVRTPAGPYVRLFAARGEVGGVPVVFRVARSEDQIRRQWNTLAVIFLATIPIAMIAAGGVGDFMAGRALEPISRMAQRAQTITADRLHERLPVGDPADEIGKLAVVFNGTFERLEEAFDRLKRFTADASHELRAPLTALRSVGEVGLRDPRTADEYRDIIGSMLEETSRLTRLVDDLLALSRLDSGRTRLTPEPTDLRALATDVAAHLGVLAEEKGVELRVRGPEATMVLADRHTLRQAVINVLDNAIKYSPPGRPVDIVVHADSGHGVLSVTDEGPGIAKEHHRRIFDRFYRVDKARNRDIEGTGLGLAIAQGAVAASHGEIHVESAEGRGSRFVIRIPQPGTTAAPVSARPARA